MKKLLILLLIALIQSGQAYSTPTVVSGKVIGGKGMTIRLMTYTDQVTYLRETLASATVGEDEAFYLTIQLDGTIYAWIDLEFRQADIYLQPGQSYEVEIIGDASALSSSYYERSVLPMSILKDDPDHLNAYIQDFNELYNDFLLNYADNIRVKGSANAYNTFKTAIGLRFQNATNAYFRDYIQYKSASMELFMRLKSRDKIGLDHLTGKPLLLNNIEYMDFFHLYFEKYFISGNKYFNYNKTYDLVNAGANLAIMLDSLSIDPVLKGNDLKELVLLSGLKELYQVKGFKRDKITALVKEISLNGSTPELREIAENLLLRFSRLKPGSQAPGFVLPLVEGEGTIDLAGFKGKYVYIAFFDSRNPASQAELSLVSEFYDDFQDKVAFVAISVDREKPVIKDNPNIPPGTWIVAHYNHDLELLESYDAITYPYFVLVDDQGRIVLCPAPSPSENIRKAFDAI